MVNKDSIDEARRYIANARKILSEKAGKEGAFYSDPKYVRMAGNTAWNGVLVALDDIFPYQHKKDNSDDRPRINWYKEKINRIDKKFLRTFTTAYDTLHKTMGYDGNLSYVTSQDGLKLASDVIEWCSRKKLKGKR